MKKSLIPTLLAVCLAAAAVAQPTITINHYNPATNSFDNGTTPVPFCSVQQYYATVQTQGPLSHVCGVPQWYDQNNNFLGGGNVINLTISGNISIHATAIVGYPDCSVIQQVSSNVINVSGLAHNIAIHGPTQVCLGTAGFNVNDLPAATPITWSVSSNLQISSGQNTSSLQVQRIGTATGTGTISASIGTFCGYTPPTLIQSVTLGIMEPAGINGLASGDHLFGGESYTLTSTGTDWQASGGTIVSGQGTNTVVFRANLNNTQHTINCSVSVRENDACGVSSYLQVFAIIDAVGSGGPTPRVVMSPNPARGIVTLSGKIAKAGAGIQVVKVYDATGKIRKTIVNGSSASTLQLNLADLGNGIYFLEIRSGTEVERQKLVIQH